VQDALAQGDVVILAVPDRVLGAVAADVVPKAKPGAMIVCLDPDAPRAGLLPERDDVTYFVTHPAHPPVFNDETDPAARRDFFGSGKAKQAIVCALMQGPEEDYAKGETIDRDMFGPITRAHRITVEQMAILEPALSETVTATCMMVIHARRTSPGDHARSCAIREAPISATDCWPLSLPRRNNQTADSYHRQRILCHLIGAAD
jgi:hypothetical protein